MKIFKKTLLVLFLLVLVSSLLFSGCRRPQVEKVSYEGVELTYYKMFDDEEVIRPIIDDFVAKYPGLRINYRKFSDFDEYQNLILNEMAEGRGPDIFSMQNTWFKSNFRKITPMPEFLSPEDMTLPEVFADVFVDVAYRDLVRPDEYGVDQVYALPMTVDTLALYYNRAHFEDRIPVRGRPSTTWEGIKEDVLLLNRFDPDFGFLEVGGIAMGRSDNISRAVDILYLLFLQHGVEFYNENISEAIFARAQRGVTDYSATDALELFTGFADEAQRHYSWGTYLADPEARANEIEAFARGRVSMVIGYSFMYDEILNKIGVLRDQGASTIRADNIRIATIPQTFDPDVTGEKRVTYASYFAETVSRNSEYPDLAWEFLVDLTSKSNLEYYFDKLKKPTSRRDMILEQQRHPIYGVFASQIGFAESFPIINYYRYKDIFEEVIRLTNLNRETARANLIDAQDQITRMLPQVGVIEPPLEIEDED